MREKLGDAAGPQQRMSAIIAVERVSKRYGGLTAVDGCSFEVPRGSITGLIGPNGAGKTTLFNIMAGVTRPDAGRVILDGEDVAGRAPHELFAFGLSRTFQIPKEWARMTVIENLMVVPGRQSGERILAAWFRPGLVRSEERAIRREMGGRCRAGDAGPDDDDVECMRIHGGQHPLFPHDAQACAQHRPFRSQRVYVP